MIKFKYNYPVHITLFLLTFFTTTISGVQWRNMVDSFELENFRFGLEYAISLLFILSCHEFGHFFAARYHGVETTLPFFIPFPPIPGVLNFGTFGAVIKTKSPVPHNIAMFDIGASGPIAGFIASLMVLIWGFTHLPSIDYLFEIHPEYIFTGIPEWGLRFGNTLLYLLFVKFANIFGSGFIPPMNEIYHYPYLCAGWFGLFVTAMNLLPIGQLDGGHIFYSMFGGKVQKLTARIFFIILLSFGLLGFLPLIDIEVSFAWPGWFLWAVLLFFVVKLEHPEIQDFILLDKNRTIIGWLCIIIFIVSFSFNPFSIPE
jgi:membrane-associated protease RseP (regulator of RpoE activity)